MTEPRTGPEHIREARECVRASHRATSSDVRQAWALEALANAEIARVLLDAEVALEMGGLPGSDAQWRKEVRPEEPVAQAGPVELTTPAPVIAPLSRF